MNKAYDLLHLNHKKGKVLLATVSGVATTKSELIRLFDRKVPSVDIITTKSFQVVPNEGNKMPVITSPRLGDFGNSVGLRNPGMEKAYPELEELRREGLRAILNVSVSANSIEDFITLVKKFDPVADMIELNLSCPHAAKGYGASIGSDPGLVRAYIKGINEAYPERKSLLIAKLTPNVEDIGAIARIATRSGADGIAAINTVGPKEYYIDGKPILFNKIGGKGGASGEWVKQRAVECIREIRNAIGDDPIILGMGGVSTAEDAFDMLSAGADSVGIGSAIARVEMSDYEAYFNAVKSGKDVSGYLGNDHKPLEYEKHVIIDKTMYSPDTIILTLDGKSDCQAGEFCFLFFSEAGERPFSVAKNNPLTFIIKIRGPFTEAVSRLEKGDVIYTRGLSGKPIENPKTDKALLIGGGTGTVVLNLLAEKLGKENTKMDIRVGVPSLEEGQKGLMQDELEKYGSYTVIADDGKPGRVLDSLKKEDVDGDAAAYIVGPSVMMRKAAEILLSFGLDPERILISLEKNTMCGVGLCGECVCGEKLTCKEGTFLPYSYILENNLEI